MNKTLISKIYDNKAWYYEPEDVDYRYILGTIGNKPLICIGINPSTAKPNDLDNTLKSVERIALANNYDSFIMFNVYPQRATNPDDMHAVCDSTLHKDNLLWFETVLKEKPQAGIWAAWGTIIEKRPYLKTCLQDMYALSKKHDISWHCAGKISKKGHPHHPLYLKKDEEIKNFEIEHYIENVLA